MLKLTFEGANTSELHQSLEEYIASINAGSTPAAAASSAAKKLKKVEPSDDEPEPKPEEAPKKKAASKSDEITDTELREKLQGNDWPIENCKAFLQKFGFPSVSAVPQKRRAELIELLEDAGTWSTKKLNAYLAPDEDL